MALTDDDVREILRLIDESDLDELRIETADFKLHVVRGQQAPRPRRRPRRSRARTGPSRTIEAPMPGTFYRAESPGKPPFVDVGRDASSPARSSGSSRS